MRMKISEAAAASGCRLETIRYYERVGLMPRPTRTGSGYRAYAPHDVERLRFISRGRELGFSLEEIRSLLRLNDDPKLSCGDVDVLARAHLADIHQRIEELQHGCGTGAGDCPVRRRRARNVHHPGGTAAHGQRADFVYGSGVPPMTLERYLEAAERENTQRSYASALRHFEVNGAATCRRRRTAWPAILADHAGQLSTNTLRHRLAALAGWHREHGFVDPTRAPLVRKVLKGIQTLHPSVEKQAEPLQLTRLAQVDGWLGAAITAARERGDHADELRHRRDRSLILLGFWRGFRGDELIRVQVEHLRLVPGEGMTCFLPRSRVTGKRRATRTRCRRCRGCAR